jgi:hypothetical protein
MVGEGFLMPRYVFDGTAAGDDDTYLDIDQVLRHSVTVRAGTCLSRGG